MHGRPYPWSSRCFANFAWPDGVRMVVMLALEYEAIRGDQQIADGIRDLREASLREFEARVGVWRTLDVVERFGLTSTVFVNGATAVSYPGSVLEIAGRGHEIAAHGYEAEDLWQLQPGEEATMIDRVTGAIETATGRRPSGWLSPRARPSEHTMELLANRGYEWNSDLFDAELPYVLEVGDRTMIEIPRSFSADDIMLPHSDPGALLAAWSDDFDWLYRESEQTPSMMIVQWHPYITGRPSRAKALEAFIAHMQRHDGIWFARGSEIAAYCRQFDDGGPVAR